MEICKNFFKFFLVLCFVNPSFSSNIKNFNVNFQDYLLVKYDLFFLKNVSKIVNNSSIKVMIYYQSLDYVVKIKDNQEVDVTVNAIMDTNRYKKKKYVPKISDCNVVRNQLVAGKYGYSLFTLKKNYSVTESLLREKIKDNVYNFSGINDKDTERLINSTNIYINIIHPQPVYNFTCSGKITQLELR